jgi:hypothetical protein
MFVSPVAGTHVVEHLRDALDQLIAARALELQLVDEECERARRRRHRGFDRLRLTRLRWLRRGRAAGVVRRKVGDLLTFAILGHDEVVPAEVAHRPPFAIGDDHVQVVETDLHCFLELGFLGYGDDGGQDREAEGTNLSHALSF